MGKTFGDSSKIRENREAFLLHSLSCMVAKFKNLAEFFTSDVFAPIPNRTFMQVKILPTANFYEIT